MAVYSSLVPLGSALPDLTLPDLVEERRNLHDLRGPGVLVVVFACNHCPYVKHIEAELGRVAADYAGRASFAAICSNDPVSHPDDDVPGLRAQADRAGWGFPYLVDADQTTARQFGAVCTPDLFVYGITGRLAYRGAFDGSTPGNGVPVSGDSLRAALDELIEGRPAPEPQRPSMGCSIKWRD